MRRAYIRPEYVSDKYAPAIEYQKARAREAADNMLIYPDDSSTVEDAVRSLLVKHALADYRASNPDASEAQLIVAAAMIRNGVLTSDEQTALDIQVVLDGNGVLKDISKTLETGQEVKRISYVSDSDVLHSISEISKSYSSIDIANLERDLLRIQEDSSILSKGKGKGAQGSKFSNYGTKGKYLYKTEPYPPKFQHLVNKDPMFLRTADPDLIEYVFRRTLDPTHPEHIKPVTRYLATNAFRHPHPLKEDKRRFEEINNDGKLRYDLMVIILPKSS